MSEMLARLIESPVGPSFEFFGYRIDRARTSAEEDAAFRFRFENYKRAGFISPADFSRGEIRDEFDSVATQIVVRDPAMEVVGACRFVPPTAIGTHTETLFRISLADTIRSRIGEFGRLAIDPRHRGGSRIVMIGMLKAFFECMMECQADLVVAHLSPALADSFAALGCKSIPVVTAPPNSRRLENRAAMQRYFDSQRPEPVLFDLESMFVDVGVSRERLFAS